MDETPFSIRNAAALTSPVVISVPHAGRAYPDLAALLQVPLHRLVACEDRFADRLAAHAIECGVTTIIAHTPRLWIDLNRCPSDLDPAMIAGACAPAALLSPKARGGLGLIPRRLAGVGEIWRRPLAKHDVDRRIGEHHRPYHAALAALLARTRAQFGAALLIDLHSMPPLAGADAATIVIGDRFGASAAPRLTDAAEALLSGCGFRVAVNVPYAGGYILDRHARRSAGVHALQIEIDRTHYLYGNGNLMIDGADRIARLIAVLAARLGEELDAPMAIAAE